MRWLLLLALAWPSPLRAQEGEPTVETPADAGEPAGEETEARALFAQANTAFEAGRNRQALELFQRVHEITGRVQLLFNIGLCYQRLGELEEARTEYRRYLVANPNAENRSDVEERVLMIDGLLAPAEEPSPVDPPPPPTPVEPETEQSRGPLWVGVAGAALAAGGAVLFGVGAAQTGSINSSNGREWTDASADQDAARRLQFIGIGIAAAGVVTAGAALIWALVRPDGSQEDLAWHF